MTAAVENPRSVNQHTAESIIGKQFQYLLVLSKSDRTDLHNKKNWLLCKCVCGKICEVSRQNLGRSQKSCGCMRFSVGVTEEKRRKKKITSLTRSEKYLNCTFNYLTIKKIYFKENKRSLWCDSECSCGKVYSASVSTVVLGKSKSCGCMKQSIISRERGGTGIPGETLELFTRIRKDNAYRKWRLLILKNSPVSILSGSTNRLEVHHLIPVNVLIKLYEITKDNYELSKHVLFDISNGVVITKQEHDLFHSTYGKTSTTLAQDFQQFAINFKRNLKCLHS